MSKPADKDLSKQWCIVYGIWDFDQNRMIRKRVTLIGETVGERIAQSESVMRELQALVGRAY